MSNKCGVVRDLLPLYIDGLCSEESKELIHSHIQSCDECKEILKTMECELQMENERERIIRLESKKPFKKVRNIVIALLGIVSISLVFATIVGYLYLTNATYNETNVVIQNLEISNSELQVEGSTFNSANGYSHFEYIVDNDNLYLYLKYNRLVSKKNSGGDFKISIKDDLESVENVFVQGKRTKDLKLIWER